MYSGFFKLFGTKANPAAWAISIIAVLVSFNTPYLASTLSTTGPVTEVTIASPFIPSTNASTVPSPPSANGIIVISVSLSTFNIPSFIAFAASIELKLLFNESIDITTFMISASLVILLYQDLNHLSIVQVLI